jgi:hypothetical protein
LPIGRSSYDLPVSLGIRTCNPLLQCSVVASLVRLHDLYQTCLAQTMPKYGREIVVFSRIPKCDTTKVNNRPRTPTPHQPNFRSQESRKSYSGLKQLSASKPPSLVRLSKALPRQHPALKMDFSCTRAYSYIRLLFPTVSDTSPSCVYGSFSMIRENDSSHANLPRLRPRPSGG